VKRLIIIVAMTLGGVALAEPPPPEPAPSSLGPEELRVPRRHPLRPIPFFYRELDLQRQNVGAQGRINATRDEQIQAETPSVRPAPFGGWSGW